MREHAGMCLSVLARVYQSSLFTKSSGVYRRISSRVAPDLIPGPSQCALWIGMTQYECPSMRLERVVQAKRACTEAAEGKRSQHLNVELQQMTLDVARQHLLWHELERSDPGSSNGGGGGTEVARAIERFLSRFDMSTLFRKCLPHCTAA